jgi:glycosyltransferase involved in cell wall biosynthesis
VPIIPEKWAENYIIKKAVKYANQADAVVVPTDSIIPILRKWGVTNKNIIPVSTGVEEKELQGADRNIVRKKYNIADDEILLLLVSRLTSEKNIEFVMRAVKKVLENTGADSPLAEEEPGSGLSARGVKLLVSGGGDLVSELKKYVAREKLENKIIITGVVERKDLKNYYAAADIFVYGSKSETQGMVVSEAMYMGLPIIAVNATGIKSLVLNNGNGFLVKEDEKEFAEAVVKLVNDKNLRQKFSETSRRISQAQFVSSVCAEKMLEVYEKATEIVNTKN